MPTTRTGRRSSSRTSPPSTSPRSTSCSSRRNRTSSRSDASDARGGSEALGEAGEQTPGGGPARTPASARARKEVGGRDLPVAITVGVLLAGVFLGSLFWHPIAFATVVAVLTALVYVESGRVLRGVGVHVEVPVLVVSTLVMLFGAYQASHLGQGVGVVVLVLGGVLWVLADPQRHDVVATLATTSLLGLWVGFLASFAVLLVNRPDDGVLVVLGVVGTAIFTDIGGYAFGVALGRHKVAPSVSPNKTWEGLLGGLAFATIAAALVLPLLGDAFTATSAAVLALVCGLAGFLGDLVESMVKRDLGVKDLGDLLPGHGGVLDRVDGILFALPVGYFAVELLTRSTPG
ncbi:phosphatidate cytidylyltransferase [Nitriliruptoraceae bacterium ZYF776]|nr:phosphatidate cytidylyltransferase [Profundirhabdus halotolerans]